MNNCKVISGLTSKTPQNLVLDAGAFFKNYNVETDTFETAVQAGKLIGATKGGGGFKAIPSFRDIELDGMRGAIKGAKLLESWEVTMNANVAEISASLLKDGLGIATTEAATNKNGYDVIKGKMCLKDEDYIENITWVGTVSGSDKPVIIQVFNALNTSGLDLSFEDKGELTSGLEFIGHFDMAKMNEVPFAIYYPKLGVGA